MGQFCLASKYLCPGNIRRCDNRIVYPKEKGVFCTLGNVLQSGSPIVGSRSVPDLPYGNDKAGSGFNAFGRRIIL